MVDKIAYIAKFKELYLQKNPRKEISDQEALDYFEKLVTLVKNTYQPLIKKSYGK